METMKKHTRRKLYSWLLVIAMVFSIVQPMPGSVKEASAQTEPDPNSPHVIKVMYDANGGKFVSGDQSKEEWLVKDENVTEWTIQDLPSPDPVLEDYAFAGWFDAVGDGGNLIEENHTITQRPDSGEITYYAHWRALQTVTVTYDGNGGVVTGDATVSAKYDAGDPDSDGAEFTLPSATRRGYRFDGWAANENGNGVVGDAAEKVYYKNNTTLYARWIPIEMSELDIEVKSVTDPTTNAPLVYDGTDKEPVVIIKDKESGSTEYTLVKDTDFEISYDSYHKYANENIGFTITGKGDYAKAGSVSESFSIEKREVIVEPIVTSMDVYADSFANSDSVPYRIKEVKGLSEIDVQNNLADVIVYDAEADCLKFKDGDDPNDKFAIASDYKGSNLNVAGEYLYSIKTNPERISNNFDVTLDESVKLNVNKLSLNGTRNDVEFKVELTGDTTLKQDGSGAYYYVYDGKKKLPAITVKCDLKEKNGNEWKSKSGYPKTLTEGIDYNITTDYAEEGTANIGEHTITITGAGDYYTGSMTSEWNIIHKTLTDDKIKIMYDGEIALFDSNSVINQTYDGKYHYVTVVPTDEEDNQEDIKDIRVLYSLTGEPGSFSEDPIPLKNANANDTNYTIYYTVDSDNHYDPSSLNGVLSVKVKIAKREVSLYVKSESKTYGAKEPDYSYDVIGSNTIVADDGVENFVKDFDANFKNYVMRDAKTGTTIQNPYKKIHAENIDVTTYSVEDESQKEWIDNYECVGDYTLKLDVDALNTAYPNYAFTDTSVSQASKLTINRKNISVTAKEVSREYLDKPADNELELVYDTLPFGESLNNPGTSLVCNTTGDTPVAVDRNTNAGTYYIEQGTVDNTHYPNYNIKYTRAKYIINKKNIKTVFDNSSSESATESLIVKCVKDDGNGNFVDSVPIFNYDKNGHTPTYAVQYVNTDGNSNPSVSKVLDLGTDYTLSGQTNKKDMGFYTVTIKGKGNYTGEISRNWMIAESKSPAQTKEVEYNGKNQTLESVVPDTKLKFPEGAVIEYNVYDSNNPAERPNSASGTLATENYDDGGLSFDYYYLPGDNKYTSNAPSIKYVGDYTVYYKVTLNGADEDTTNDRIMYFSYDLKITPKKVVLVAVDNKKVYGTKNPNFGIRVIKYEQRDYSSKVYDSTLQNSTTYPNALCSGDKLEGYSVKLKEKDTNNNYIDVSTPLTADCGEEDEYRLFVEKDTATQTDVAVDSFAHNYSIPDGCLCPGMFTITKADYDAESNGFVIADPVEVNSKTAGEVPVDVIMKLIKGSSENPGFGESKGFKNITIAHTADDEAKTIDLDNILKEIKNIDEDLSPDWKVDLTDNTTGEFKIQLTDTAKVQKTATLYFTVSSKNYKDISLPVTIKTTKNDGRIALKNGFVSNKEYDGEPISINYRNFDITSMRYDSVNNKYYDVNDPGYNDSFGYDVSFKYEKHISDNNYTEVQQADTKNAGVYRITATLKETSEYTSANTTVDYEIKKKEVAVSVSAPAKPHEYDGKYVAQLPDIEVQSSSVNGDPVTGVDGESFNIKGLTGVYLDQAGSNGTPDANVSLDGGIEVNKPIRFIDPTKPGDYTSMTDYNDLIKDYKIEIPSTSKAELTDAGELKNYTIKYIVADNFVGKIVQKEIKVPVPTASPKPYDGNSVAKFDDIVVSDKVTGVTGETFTISKVTGNYVSISTTAPYNAVEDPNVSLGDNPRTALAKDIKLNMGEYTLSSDNPAVTINNNKLNNYILKFVDAEGNPLPTTHEGNYLTKGIIEKRPLTVVLPTPAPKQYDGNSVATIPEVTVKGTDAGFISENENDYITISGLKGVYVNDKNNPDKNAGEDDKKIILNNPYATNVSQATIADYQLGVAGNIVRASDDSNKVGYKYLKNYEITFQTNELAGKITKKEVNVPLANPLAKVYDGTYGAKLPDVKVNGAAGEYFTVKDLTGTYMGDAVAPAEPQPDANVKVDDNTGKAVAKNVKFTEPSSISIDTSKSSSDFNLANYDINFTNKASLTGVINKAKVVYKITAEDKEYDGKKDAKLKIEFVGDNKPIGDEKITVNGFKGEFDSTDVAYDSVDKTTIVSIPVTVTRETSTNPYTVENAVLNNYDIHLADANKDTTGVGYAKLEAKITPKKVYFLTKFKDKTYDGTTNANVDDEKTGIYYKDNDNKYQAGTNVVRDDGEEKISIKITEASFDNANVGQDKLVTVKCEPKEYSISGTNLHNYNIRYIQLDTEGKEIEGDNSDTGYIGGKASITPKELTVNYKSKDKPYDGTKTAEVEGTVDTGVENDTIKITGLTGQFEKATADKGIKVVVNHTNPVEKDGEGNPVTNYRLKYPDADENGANIEKRKVKITTKTLDMTNDTPTLTSNNVVKYGATLNINVGIEYQANDSYVVFDNLGDTYAGTKIENLKTALYKGDIKNTDTKPLPGTYTIGIDEDLETKYPNYDITVNAGTITIEKADAAKPKASDITVTKPDTKTSNNGSVKIAQTALENMQYKDTAVANDTWTDLDVNGIISDLGDTTLLFRYKETETTFASESLSIKVEAKITRDKPDTSEFKVTKATSATASDGKMDIPAEITGLEYSKDNGNTWAAVPEPASTTDTVVTVEGLPVEVLVRAAAIDEANYMPSEAVTVTIGNLEVDKTAAKEAIDDEAATITAQIDAYAFKKLSQTDINGYKNAVTTQATNGRTAVDNATTVAGVDEKKQDAIKAIDDVFAAAKAKDDIDALNAAKEEAVNAIDSEVKAATTAIKALTYLTVNQQNTYIEAIVKEGDNDTIFEKGKAQINAANTIEDVKTEKEATFNNIAKKLSEAKAANLTSAKTKANTSVESSATTANITIGDLNLLTPEEKSSYIGQVNTIAERFKAQIAAVTEPTTLAYTNITQYETDAKTAITKVVTTAKGTELNKAKQNAKEVVNAAKESAITAIDAMTKLSADEIAGFKAQITSTDVDTAIVEVALNAIDAAATPDAATNAGRDAKAAIEAVVKNAQDKDVDNARTEANDAVDAKALEAKTAIQALKNLKPEDITGYIESIDKENTTGTIVAAAKAAIAEAATVADVGTAKEDAIDKIAKKVKDAKEADLAAAKKAAKDDVEAARNTANNAINALNEGLEPDTELVTEAERNSYKAQVSQIEVNFKDKIGAITDPDKVNDIATFKEAAVKAIQDVVTTAQKDALKKAKDSAEQIIDYYKLSAFKEIEDLPNLSDEEKKTYKESIFKENDTNCIINAQLSIVENSDIAAVVINAAYDAFDAIEEVINNAKAADVLKKAKEDAEAVVITAKNAAVDAIKELTKLSDAEKADFTARITKTGVDTAIAEAALKAINNAATPEAATKAGSDAKTNIEAVVKEAQDKDVANAKDAAIKAVNAKVTEAKAVIGALKNLEATEITKYIDTIDKENTNDTIVAIGKAAIDAATKVADIDKAKEDTIDNIDAEIVKAKNADLTAAKEAAAKIVADAKTEADTEINALTLLTTEEKSSYSGQLKGIADSFKAKTDAVTSPEKVDDIAGYAEDAVEAIADVLEAAVATEYKKARDNATLVVNTAKVSAFNTISALPTLSDVEKEAYTNLIYKENDAETIVNAALAAIKDATTVEGIANAGTNAVELIQGVVTVAKAADDLKKAKEDAEAVVKTAKETAVDTIDALTNLSDTEKAGFTDRITKADTDTALAEAALKAIKNAETPEAATKAGSDAKAAIEAVVTEAQGKDIDNAKNAANKAVDDKVSEAETVIQALTNLVSDSKTELIEKIVKEGSKDTIEAKGKAAISAATSADKVDEARNAAIAEIDATIAEAKNSDLTAGKAAAKQAVGDVKAEANDAIESLAPILTSDEINAYLNQISKIEENFTTKTDAVTVDKVGDIIKYTDEAITAINEVAVIADSVYLKKAKADSKKVINDAVLEGKETVKQLNSLSDTEKGDYYEAIEMAANEGNSSIDAVATSDKLGDIVTAKLDAVDAINKTVEDAKAANTLKKGKADAIAIVNTAKDSAIAAINELDNLSADEKKAYTDSIYKENGGNATANFALNMIKKAETADKAMELANTAKTAIETTAENAKADDALKKAKADATTVINTAKENALKEISELSGLTEEEQTKFADSVASSVNGSMGMLQNADTPAKATGIANGAKSGIENIVKNARAQSALNAAKEEAKNSLSSDLVAAAVVMATLDDLSEEEASEYLNRIAAENDPEAIFNVATKAIKEADTADKAKEAANTAHNAINDIMIEAQAKNMANAKQTAVGAVNSAVNKAAETINALKNLSADDKKAVIDGIGNKDAVNSIAGKALSGIDKATDASDAKKISAECVTAIEAEVDKAVKADLNKAKENAKNEILASKEAAEKAIDETEGLTAKEKASYKALINSNTESAIKAIDKVTQSSEIADITEEVTGVNEVIAKAKDDSSLDAAKNIAAKAIKREADKAVDSISDMKYLSDSAKKEFKDKISAIDADNAVEPATTAEKINENADVAKANINKIIADAKTANLNAAKTQATEEVNDKGDKAKEDINSLSELPDNEAEGYTEKVDELTEAAENAIAGITDPDKADEVMTKKDEAVTAINEVVKEAEDRNKELDKGTEATPTPSPTTDATTAPSQTPMASAAPSASPAADNSASPSSSSPSPIPGTVNPTAAPNPLKAADISALSLNKDLKVNQKGKKITVKWGKVTGATKYKVFAQYCGKAFSKDANATRTVASATIKKINGKALDLKKNYKVVVKAYKGNKELGKTIVAHIVGVKNTKYTNVNGIDINSEKNIKALEVGSTSTIEAETNLVDDSKLPLSNAHAKEFRYASSNPSVAKVNGSGKITAVATGKCTIYVYARNGFAEKVSVTVP